MNKNDCPCKLSIGEHEITFLIEPKRTWKSEVKLFPDSLLQPFPPTEHSKCGITFRKHQAIVKKKKFGGQLSQLSSLLRLTKLHKRHIHMNFNIHGKESKYSRILITKVSLGLVEPSRLEGQIQTDTTTASPWQTRTQKVTVKMMDASKSVLLELLFKISLKKPPIIIQTSVKRVYLNTES